VSNAEFATPDPESEVRLRSGIEGFDDILYGGFPRNHLYLIEGNPGSYMAWRNLTAGHSTRFQFLK
jgi:predicted ATP-dependent serine protease